MGLAIIVIGRVAQLQLSGSGAAIATERRTVLAAARGDLLDRTGQPLAVNDSVGDVFVDAIGVSNGLRTWGPKDRAALQADLDAVRSVLGIDAAAFNSKVAVDSHWVSLKKGISASEARSIRDLDQTLVTVIDRPQRVYPDGATARGIVGSVHATITKTPAGEMVDDLEGKSGLEKLLNRELTGVAGELLTERGPGNREIPSPNRRLVPSRKGTSFMLSLDRSLQFQAEQNLSRALVTYGAAGGYVGVMDVDTGDLLASVAMEVDTETGVVRSKGYNAGVIDTYEPGSTMKPFTMAAALDSGTLSTQTRFNVPDSLVMKFRKEQKKFTDDTPHKTQYWSVRDVLVNSSNVGTIMVARKLGPEAVNDNLKQFGFGRRTGIADPAKESAGIMRDVKDWSGVDIGTVPIGQGISVSPVQMLAAMNALAADGEYVTPRLVTASIGADGTRSERAVQRRRVVTSETAAEVRSMLTDVVKVGTGKRAAVEGYAVAGKTGTAQKAEKGRYSETAYVASFAGFYPAESPKLSILVILDEPYEEYGGLTAAPVFADMVRITAQRYRIAPQRIDGRHSAGSQVLVTPELRAVNDPRRQAVAPVRSIPAADANSGPSTVVGPTPNPASSKPADAPKAAERDTPKPPTTAGGLAPSTVVTKSRKTGSTTVPRPKSGPVAAKTKTKEQPVSARAEVEDQATSAEATDTETQAGAVGVAGGAVTAVGP